MEGLAASQYGPVLKPFDLMYPQDLSSAWKTSGRGGACKNANFFCNLCSCMSERILLWEEGENCCERCINNGTLKCWHHKICDMAWCMKVSDELKTAMQNYVAQHRNEYDEIKKLSKLWYDHTIATKLLDPFHIDYEIPEDSDAQTHWDYIKFIAQECTLQKLNV